jgi:7-cyano-7-deazaguanine synthase
MKIVSIVSGGLDSICYTAYKIAKARYDGVDSPELYSLSFTYGQKGSKELDIAQKIIMNELNGVSKLLDISFMKQLWLGTQLTDDTEKVKDHYEPSVVVPIRNMVFLTIGLAYAYSIAADEVIYGSHLNDVALAPDGEFLYPDCHPNAALAIETAAKISHFRKAKRVKILSPGIEGFTKAENLAKGYDVLGDKIFETWSCYKSLDKQCGECESCRNRKDAFYISGIEDKTEYLK